MWIKYRTSIILAVTFAVLFSAFWFFPALAFIVFLSILMQLLLTPWVDRLSRRISRGLASAIVCILFVLILVGALTVITSTVIPNFKSFVENLPKLSQRFDEMFDMSDWQFISVEFNHLIEQLTAFSVDALQSSLMVIVSVFNKIIDFVIIIFVTFYLLKDGEKIKNYLAELFPKSDYHRIINLFNKILASLQAYVRGQSLICLITGIIVFTYFSIRGQQYASIFAVVSGVAEFIPVLGPTVASAFAVLLTATQSMSVAVQTIFFFLVLTQVNHNVVSPMLLGRSLKLHPVAIILGVIFGGELLGAAGMFLAVPCIGVIKLIIEDIHENNIKNRQLFLIRKRILKKGDLRHFDIEDK